MAYLRITLLTTIAAVILGLVVSPSAQLVHENFLHRASFLQLTREEKKIDPAVLAQMQTQSQISVIILGTEQLLETPGGFEEFTQANAEVSRTELRNTIVPQLKQIASLQQARISEELGNIDGLFTTWLVNAVFATLTSEQISQISLSEDVKFIYPQTLGSVVPGPPGGVGQVIQASPTRTPFTTSGKQIPWNVEQIGASRVWSEFDMTGEGIVVAAIDFGVNYNHPDLQSNIWINDFEVPNNGVDDDLNGYVDDLYGFDFAQLTAEVGNFDSSNHGTWVSGIIAGDGTSGIVTGLAPRAQIMPMIIGNTYGTILAHQYALEQGADITNMSFSIPNLGNLRGVWRLMAEQAIIAGLVLVSGAGNFQQSAPLPVQLRTPEAIPSVIAAGGVDQNLNVTSFSSLGPVEWESVKFYEDFAELIKPDIVGFPGAGYPLLEGSGQGYVDPNTNIRGNSFSGPHASGVAALILSANPELPAWRVKEIMESTATDIPPFGKDNQAGWGLINAFKAVELALAERE